MRGLCRWAADRESGRPWAARLMLALVLAWTRAARWLLVPIALYYLLTGHTARAASRIYWARITGRPARLRDMMRQFHNFAAVILDRALLLAGRDDRFRIDVEGLETVLATLQNGGAILLGAHLGSFEILRSLAHRAPVRVRAFMFRHNAGAVTALLESLAPQLQNDVIEIGAPDAMLRVQDALRQGELVGMLADRAPRTDRFVAAPFLGEPAPFPTGPLLVAAMLRVPVLLCHAVRIGPGHYRIAFENFADRIDLPRADRMASLHPWVARYAARVESWCRDYPDNWFNFYDFWNPHAEIPHS